MTEPERDNFPAVTRDDVDDLALLPRRFEQLVSRFDHMLETTLARMMNSIDKLTETVADVRHQQGNLFDCMGRMDGRLDAITGELRETRKHFDARLSAVETKLAQHEVMHADVDRRLEALERRRGRARRVTSKRTAATRKAKR